MGALRSRVENPDLGAVRLSAHVAGLNIKAISNVTVQGEESKDFERLEVNPAVWICFNGEKRLHARCTVIHSSGLGSDTPIMCPLLARKFLSLA